MQNLTLTLNRIPATFLWDLDKDFYLSGFRLVLNMKTIWFQWVLNLPPKKKKNFELNKSNIKRKSTKGHILCKNISIHARRVPPKKCEFELFIYPPYTFSGKLFPYPIIPSLLWEHNKVVNIRSKIKNGSRFVGFRSLVYPTGLLGLVW